MKTISEQITEAVGVAFRTGNKFDVAKVEELVFTKLYQQRQAFQTKLERVKRESLYLS